MGSYSQYLDIPNYGLYASIKSSIMYYTRALYYYMNLIKIKNIHVLCMTPLLIDEDGNEKNKKYSISK